MQTQNLDFSESLNFLENLEEADIGKAKNLGESNQSSQDSHENDISETVLSKPEVENETIRVGNKGIQPFDHVYLRKKRPQRKEPNDSRNWQSSKDPSVKNPSSFVQPIQNIVESKSVLTVLDLVEPIFDKMVPTSRSSTFVFLFYGDQWWLLAIIDYCSPITYWTRKYKLNQIKLH